MEWGYAIIAGLFILGVLLAFPLAIGICAVLEGIPLVPSQGAY